MVNFLNNRVVIILISMIWGFGLALLFRRVCHNDQCVVVKIPPDFNKSNGIIYDRGNRCYKLKKYPSECAY